MLTCLSTHVTVSSGFSDSRGWKTFLSLSRIRLLPQSSSGNISLGLFDIHDERATKRKARWFYVPSHTSLGKIVFQRIFNKGKLKNNIFIFVNSTTHSNASLINKASQLL